MTTIQIDIDEVPVRIGNQEFNLTNRFDPESCGTMNFSIDVKIEPDGEWNITEVYPAIGWDDNMATIRGKMMTGPLSRNVARFLEGFASKFIQDKVVDTIMQSDRKQFPKAVVV